MIDLVCLVADKNMEAAISALLMRPESLAIRPITNEILVHPHRDPGCYNQAQDLLRGFRGSAEHALVVLDHAWDGTPDKSGARVEELLGSKLREAGMADWALPVVIEPELEVWIFSDSPHLAPALGWTGREPNLRQALASQDLWKEGALKPVDPKAALEWALREVRKPRSSSIYRNLATRISTRRCQDRSFLRLRKQLQLWFPPNTDQ